MHSMDGREFIRRDMAPTAAARNATSSSRNGSGISDRGAQFFCALAVADERERLCGPLRNPSDGRIRSSPPGAGGFGYDPVFFVPSLGKDNGGVDGGAEESSQRAGPGAGGTQAVSGRHGETFFRAGRL